MKTLRQMSRHPESPWILVAGIVLTLALLDRFDITGHHRVANRVLDWTIIVCGLAGSLVAWTTSYRSPLRERSSIGAGLAIRIFLSWLMGPFAIIGVAMTAHDIDGGLLLVYPPLFGVPLALLVLPYLMVGRHLRQRKALAASESATPDGPPSTRAHRP